MIMSYDQLRQLYGVILSGNLNVLMDVNNQSLISEAAVGLINQPHWNQEQQEYADLLIRISNTAYNNTSLDVLPLDDGVYDQLLQIYKQYNPNYQVGSAPTTFEEVPMNENGELEVMAVAITDKEKESKMYVKDILNQYTPFNQRYVTIATKAQPISKRVINTKHSYPELVGTLDKCKFVLNCDAAERGVIDKPSVQIFERDFIQKHMTMGVINPVEVFELIGELKYDGISVEAEVLGDTIISARSRGDTAEDIATDLTPILGGYKFRNAVNIPKDKPFGIKFEAVITKRDLELMSIERNKSYRNCRNAIIGLFGSSDAYRFVDYITLIPLATSLEMDRISELQSPIPIIFIKYKKITNNIIYILIYIN